jgi:hypothetical protein
LFSYFFPPTQTVARFFFSKKKNTKKLLFFRPLENSKKKNELRENEMAALCQSVDAQEVGNSPVLHDVIDMIGKLKDADCNDVELVLRTGQKSLKMLNLFSSEKREQSAHWLFWHGQVHCLLSSGHVMVGHFAKSLSAAKSAEISLRKLILEKFQDELEEEQLYKKLRVAAINSLVVVAQIA